MLETAPNIPQDRIGIIIGQHDHRWGYYVVSSKVSEELLKQKLDAVQRNFQSGRLSRGTSFGDVTPLAGSAGRAEYRMHGTDYRVLANIVSHIQGLPLYYFRDVCTHNQLSRWSAPTEVPREALLLTLNRQTAAPIETPRQMAAPDETLERSSREGAKGGSGRKQRQSKFSGGASAAARSAASFIRHVGDGQYRFVPQIDSHETSGNPNPGHQRPTIASVSIARVPKLPKNSFKPIPINFNPMTIGNAGALLPSLTNKKDRQYLQGLAKLEKQLKSNPSNYLAWVRQFQGVLAHPELLFEMCRRGFLLYPSKARLIEQQIHTISRVGQVGLFLVTIKQAYSVGISISVISLTQVLYTPVLYVAVEAVGYCTSSASRLVQITVQAGTIFLISITGAVLTASQEIGASRYSTMMYAARQAVYVAFMATLPTLIIAGLPAARSNRVPNESLFLQIKDFLFYIIFPVAMTGLMAFAFGAHLPLAVYLAISFGFFSLISGLIHETVLVTWSNAALESSGKPEAQIALAKRYIDKGRLGKAYEAINKAQDAGYYDTGALTSLFNKIPTSKLKRLAKLGDHNAIIIFEYAKLGKPFTMDTFRDAVRFISYSHTDSVVSPIGHLATAVINFVGIDGEKNYTKAISEINQFSRIIVLQKDIELWRLNVYQASYMQGVMFLEGGHGIEQDVDFAIQCLFNLPAALQPYPRLLDNSDPNKKYTFDDWTSILEFLREGFGWGRAFCQVFICKACKASLLKSLKNLDKAIAICSRSADVESVAKYLKLMKDDQDLPERAAHLHEALEGYSSNCREAAFLEAFNLLRLGDTENACIRLEVAGALPECFQGSSDYNFMSKIEDLHSRYCAVIGEHTDMFAH